MKSTNFIPMMVLLGIALMAPSCSSSKKTSDTASVYACPMHPEIKGKKGDTCSKCHMALTALAPQEMGCCPMHQECTGKAGAKCPKCNMPMDQPVEPYVCPMHPDQKGVKGGHCPKCHMDLEPQKAQKGHG